MWGSPDNVVQLDFALLGAGVAAWGVQAGQGAGANPGRLPRDRSSPMGHRRCFGQRFDPKFIPISLPLLPFHCHCQVSPLQVVFLPPYFHRITEQFGLAALQPMDGFVSWVQDL